MITVSQIRAARALVRSSAEKLAEQPDRGWKRVQRLESTRRLEWAAGVPSSDVRTLEAAGVVFIYANALGPGVRLRDPNGPRI